MRISLLTFVISSFLILITSDVTGAAPRSNYKYYFTWTNYSVGDPSEQAVYLWNGKKVGVGRQGFHEVLKHLNRIPDKSTVYVFPDAAKWRYEGSAANPIQYFPFFEYLADLQHAEQVKDLSLIFTRKDQNGRMLDGF